MITCRDIKGLCRIKGLLPDQLKDRSVGRPTKGDQEYYLDEVERAREKYVKKEESDQVERQENLQKKFTEMKGFSDMTKHKLTEVKLLQRQDKEHDIEIYLSKANEYVQEIREQIESEEKQQKNRLRNRGAKLGLFFVHEKILELIEMYIEIYKYECRDSCKNHPAEKIELSKNRETKTNPNRKVSEKDKQRNIASALEGRIRQRLESAESCYNYKLYDRRLKNALIPFLREKLSHEQLQELIYKLQNASYKDLLAEEKKASASNSAEKKIMNDGTDQL